MTATSEPDEGGDSHDHHFGGVDSIDQPFVTRLPQVHGNDGGLVTFRPVAQDPVFFLAAHHSPQLAGRHDRPDVLLQVLS